ncbi:MAG: hypothetical protein JNL25_06925 [Rhodospirillaceae bacterium]|nr:hypothetical protein [Rhodospirillaceae bacterium]
MQLRPKSASPEPSLAEQIQRLLRLLRDPGEAWAAFSPYIGIGRKRRLDPITDVAGLCHFLETRASFVAQTSLYGYLRTRAGQRYPELFDNQVFIRSINQAKWQIWLACLSDLAVYAGGLLSLAAPSAAGRVGPLIEAAVARTLEETGVPPDAGPEFLAGAQEVRARLAGCDWSEVTDSELAFSQSPKALVKWAPVVDKLKELDEPIVLNSVRFRWQEVRRDLRRCLDPAALLRS